MLFTPHTRLRFATPGQVTLKALLTAFALLLFTAACDGPVGPQGDRGPQGPEGPQGPAGQDGQDGADGQDGQQGPQGPAGEDGQDGNANVTLYVFPGHDFAVNNQWLHCFESLDEAAWEESQWSIYLRRDNVVSGIEAAIFPAELAGFQYVANWNVNIAPYNCTDKVLMQLLDSEDSNLPVDAIHVIRIEASNVEDCSGGCLRASQEPTIPEELDKTDYNAVVEYYGLTEDDIVRM